MRQTGQLTGVLLMQVILLEETLLDGAICCVESYRSMRALMLFSKPSASWSSVAKACLIMS